MSDDSGLFLDDAGEVQTPFTHSACIVPVLPEPGVYGETNTERVMKEPGEVVLA